MENMGEIEDFDEREKWVYREMAKKIVDDVIEKALDITGS